MVLYVATTNPGKLRDFAWASDGDLSLQALPGLAEMPVPEEDAETFEGNARIKAEAYSRAAPGVLVLADDSGLEVDRLGGAPGVRSARLAQDRGFAAGAAIPTDARNNLCLLAELEGVAEPRRARYRCVLAVARSGVVLATAAGAVEGSILTEPRGSAGFGYDPLFLLPGLGMTMAEIPGELRTRYSHRAEALRNLLRDLPREAGERAG